MSLISFPCDAFSAVQYVREQSPLLGTYRHRDRRSPQAAFRQAGRHIFRLITDRQTDRGRDRQRDNFTRQLQAGTDSVIQQTVWTQSWLKETKVKSFISSLNATPLDYQ